MTSGRWANPLLCERFKAILANFEMDNDYWNPHYLDTCLKLIIALFLESVLNCP
ncbi:hypothetical protein SLEP1_g46527 [Rubroshorea leprosula]|uniref:Uncharacterized protein n=1 Tax=Rubroshorea leprosula TaxID=152421 RepID=A0AAV5LN92_9ROSI|nr:hypothetical protein SLEP1_g46527 [Rubroshorea leprosula]